MNSETAELLRRLKSTIAEFESEYAEGEPLEIRILRAYADGPVNAATAAAACGYHRQNRTFLAARKRLADMGLLSIESGAAYRITAAGRKKLARDPGG